MLVGIAAVVIVGIAAVVVVVFTMGVVGGGGGLSTSEYLVLEDSSGVTNINVVAILASEDIPALLQPFSSSGLPIYYQDDDPLDWKDEWRDRWDDRQLNLGITLDEVSSIVLVSGPATYQTFSGSFLANDVRNWLEEEDYKDGNYRNQEIWIKSDDAVGLLEMDSEPVVVTGNVDDVQSLLKAVDRDKGFIDDSSALKEVLDNAGDGLVIVAAPACSSRIFTFSKLGGCDAGIEIITGGDLDTTLLSGVYVFGSERRSESGADAIEEAIEGQDVLDVDLGGRDSSQRALSDLQSDHISKGS